MTHDRGRRGRLIGALLGPFAPPVEELARREHVPRSTLYLWRTQLEAQARTLFDHAGSTRELRMQLAAATLAVAMNDTQLKGYADAIGVDATRLARWCEAYRALLRENGMEPPAPQVGARAFAGE